MSAASFAWNPAAFMAATKAYRRAHPVTVEQTHRHRQEARGRQDLDAPRISSAPPSRGRRDRRPVVELARKAAIATPMTDAIHALIAERAKHLDR